MMRAPLIVALAWLRPAAAADARCPQTGGRRLGPPDTNDRFYDYKHKSGQECCAKCAAMQPQCKSFMTFVSHNIHHCYLFDTADDQGPVPDGHVSWKWEPAPPPPPPAPPAPPVDKYQCRSNACVGGQSTGVERGVCETNCLAGPPPPPGSYLVGVGKADMTGPIVQVAMMGMANTKQKGAGLHIRLYARGFVVADPSGANRVAFVSVDNGMPSTAMREEVTARLLDRFPDGRYTARNVMISGTHTHSGPAGYFEYFLDQITSMGFNAQVYEAFVQGVVDAVSRADSALQPGTMNVAMAQLGEDSNINRSPTSYLQNPAEERARYPDGDTDKGMLQLQLNGPDGAPLGVFNWFAIHGTVMNNTNEYVSGDSRGLASQRVEQRMGGGALAGEEKFVAAFTATNLGDVSPNLGGMICHTGPAAGQPCNITTSTCPEHTTLHPNKLMQRTEGCWMLGPGKDGDMFKSNHIMAEKQVAASMSMVNGGNHTQLTGPVGGVHQYINMSNYMLRSGDGKRTCPAGMGFAFAAGTVDGPGDFDFHQHTLKGDPTMPFWDFLTKDILDPLLSPWFGGHRPRKEDYECHAEKPVLLYTGFYHLPWKWHPDVLDLQVIRVGDLFIIGVPGEFTTMAGRRMREAVHAQLVKSGAPDTARVVLAGLSNQYTHYITTREEYAHQRYEGASTLYGPHSLEAYQEIFSGLATALVTGDTPPVGTPPKSVPLFKLPQLLRAPGRDRLPIGVHFGEMIKDVDASYSGLNEDTFVKMTFYAANPRHDMHLGGSYLYVERKDGDTWVAVANDASETTRIGWKAARGKTNEEVRPDFSEYGETGTDGNPSHPQRHLWGPLLWMLGETTGVRVDITMAQKCFAEGKGVDMSRAVGNATSCGSGDVSVQHRKRSHPMMLFHDSLSDGLFGHHSVITASWQPAIPGVPAAQPGTYRLRYAGEYKKLFKKNFVPFTAVSSEFTVAP